MDIPYHTPLSSAQQSFFGIEPAGPFALADQVRFSELDMLGHVNNKAYFEWFERARVRYIQAWGLWGAEAPRTVIRSGHIHYLSEILDGADYAVTCGCTGYRKTSFSLRQEVWCAGAVATRFDCVMVLLQPTGKRRLALPASLIERFTAVDGASHDA